MLLTFLTADVGTTSAIDSDSGYYAKQKSVQKVVQVTVTLKLKVILVAMLMVLL